MAIKRFIKEEEGASVIEYTIIIGLISLAAFKASGELGRAISFLTNLYLQVYLAW